MIIPLEPKLEGLAEQRYYDFFRRLSEMQEAGDHEGISALVEEESHLAHDLRDLRGQCEPYIASIRVLGDLAHLGWKLKNSQYGLELHSPRSNDESVSESDHLNMSKEAIRKQLRPRVLRQFGESSVREFVNKMEHPSKHAHHTSIRALIADGAELKKRLLKGKRINDREKRTKALGNVIQPYLQLVDGNDRDAHTRILLRDIWRYFRYTWSIPQTPIPGRSLQYLVRDAAHKSHAVVGIAALNNCAVKVAPRDRAIGWNTNVLIETLTELLSPESHNHTATPKESVLTNHWIYGWLQQLLPTNREVEKSDKKTILEHVANWLQLGLRNAINDIELQGLVSHKETQNPTKRVINRLRNLSKDYASRRQTALAQVRIDNSQPNLETEQDYTPVDDSVIDLEGKYSSDENVIDSRRMLVRKKRAFELSRLLESRRIMAENLDDLTNPDTVFKTMEREEIRTALNTAIGAIKGQRIGTSMLEITTCGAVAPYNSMLGGKLVSLLLLSPQVAADYNRRYGKEPTIIRSQLKNSPVVPDNTLVWLGTTSLYSKGSSQYERLRLPAGVISPDQPDIRFRYLGNTTGYGTVQFSDETVRALDIVLQKERGYRDVNSIFGEGASPRLRKLRLGLDALGFNAGLVMMHHQERRVYGVPLFNEAGAYLCGLNYNPPDYICSPEVYVNASDRITEFWRHRWLSQRLEHDVSWENLGRNQPQLLSSMIPEYPSLTSHTPNITSNMIEDKQDITSDEMKEFAFWQNLAHAGPNAIAEGLSDRDFEFLHVKTELEDLLLQISSNGTSLILTGNAGDGKTHLALSLKRRLKSEADRFEFILDATAIMTKENGVQPIVDKWRQAIEQGKSVILAVNQYPLFRLRQLLVHELPGVADEIDKQWSVRLNPAGEITLANSGGILLVDLSLRNPLSESFAQSALELMLNRPTLKQYALSKQDPNFTFNYERLSHPEVASRLLDLFGRVVSSGRRATIRELWILYAKLLFGSKNTPSNAGAQDSWYSERLFEYDIRFPLTNALIDYADPFTVSHPHIDRNLEAPRNLDSSGWIFDNDIPESIPAHFAVGTAQKQGRDKHRRRFAAVKRRFYFENTTGGEEDVFRFDDRPNARFHEVLKNPERDTEFLSELIESINRCYLPQTFEGRNEKLFLWVGHRLDEQPTISFVANEYIPHYRLTLKRPGPPLVFNDTFKYVPDHLALCVILKNGNELSDVTLRIDFRLYEVLSSIEQGLPRHLLNLGELNRVDSFIDKARQANPEVHNGFLVYNTEHAVASTITTSNDNNRYSTVHRIGIRG